jgi:hypothetical protein
MLFQLLLAALLDEYRSGPPYAGVEVVFDEDDIEGCALEPTTEA